MHTIQQLPANAKNEIVLGVTLDAGAKARGDYHHVTIVTLAAAHNGLGFKASLLIFCDGCKSEKCKGASLARALVQRDLVPAIAAAGTNQRQPA